MQVCELEMRVRYAETDQMRVAHHSSYFVWFEAGRTEFIRERGRSYAQVENAGWLLVVVEAHCHYRVPARYDDVLVIRTRLGALGAATLEFHYEAVRKADGAVLAEGRTVHAAVDRTGRARRIPPEIRELLVPPAAPSAATKLSRGAREADSRGLAAPGPSGPLPGSRAGGAVGPEK